MSRTPKAVQDPPAPSQLIVILEYRAAFIALRSTDSFAPSEVHAFYCQYPGFRQASTLGACRI
jgi:hypothetical protein